MNSTPSGERIHIAFFGRRNAGKSTLINAFTSQELSVTSDIPGTTTDPVSKAMELLPIGPVLITDTAGYDDEGELGEKRVKKTEEILRRTDIAVLVTDCTIGEGACEKELIRLFEEKGIPYLTVMNKCDLLDTIPDDGRLYVSAPAGINTDLLKERVARLHTDTDKHRLVSDLVKPGDLVVLCIPIDKAAPKGRLILPQQQVIRDLLDAGASAVTVRDTELAGIFDKIDRPAMVITDSQAFSRANADTPADIPLTSFSILMARYKGFLEDAVMGAAAIDRLKDGDTVLISEGCTHHRQCGDIGTVKLPALLERRTGKKLRYEFSSGRTFPEGDFSLVIHCGGCMLNAREMEYRIDTVKKAGIPVTNYGVAIAHMNGILRRSLEVIPDISEMYINGQPQPDRQT